MRSLRILNASPFSLHAFTFVISCPPNAEGGLAIHPPHHCREAHQPCEQEAALVSVCCGLHRPRGFSSPRVSVGSGFSACASGSQLLDKGSGEATFMLVQRVAAEVKAITREAALARSMGGALCPLPWGALATSSSTWPHNFHTEIKIHCLFQNLCLFLMGE